MKRTNGNRRRRAERGRKKSGRSVPRTLGALKKFPKNKTQSSEFFLAKAVSGPEGMRLIPRGEDFSHALVSSKHSRGNAGLRSGCLVFARHTGNKKNGSKESIPLVSVEKIIGRAGEFETEKRAIECKYFLAGKFPDAVLSQAEQVCGARLSDGSDGRTDLRGKTIFTIDGDDAKDYDDAVGIRKERSGFTLWVCIADVSHYVAKGSPLDREAMRRGTSVYLEDRVIPMLPELLSNDICSLVPKRDRLTKTVEMKFSGDGVLNDFRIYNSVIKSAARLTYSKVNAFLEKGVKGGMHSELLSGLKMMKTLYGKIKKRSLRKGELDFDLPEPQIVRDGSGKVTDVVKAQRGVANMIIEQFMIAANRAVGMKICESAGVGVYRIHEPPAESSISELASDLAKLGYRFDVSDGNTGGAIQKLLDHFKGKKEESAVKMMTLKSLQRAVYSTRRAGHFGLAIDEYTHFTSPIRRYPDIVAHRIIDCLASGEKSRCSRKTVEEICERASVLERNSERAERETVGLETANFMKLLVGRQFTGTVVSILPFGMFLELREVCAEGFVPRERMQRGGRRKWFNLGQELKLRVVGADLEKRRTIMEPV